MEELRKDALINLGVEFSLPDLLNYCKISNRMNESICQKLFDLDNEYEIIDDKSQIRKLLPKIRGVICQERLSETYLKEQISKSSLFVSRNKKTREIQAVIFFDLGEIAYISMCSLQGHGKRSFDEFISRFYPKIIQIDSVPSAVGFWRKLGFRIINYCGDKEDERISELIDTYTSEPFSSHIPEEDEDLETLWHFIWPHFDDEQLEEYLYNDNERIVWELLEDFRSDEGLRMLWCKK